MSRHASSIPCPYGPIAARGQSLHVGGLGVFAERDIRSGQILIRERAMAFAYPQFLFWRVPTTLAMNLDRDELELHTGIPLPLASARSAEFSVTAQLLEAIGPEAGAWLTGRLLLPRAGSQLPLAGENTTGLFPPLTGDSVEDFQGIACESAQGMSGKYSPCQCAEVLAVAHRNAWTLRGFLTDAEYGYGLFHWGSLFNSSCAPNAIALFEGTHIVVRSLREIQKNEEITVAYNATSPHHALQVRSQRNFHCICPRCERDRAVQLSIPHEEQEHYFQTLGESVTREVFSRIPEVARNVEVYQLLSDSGIAEIMSVAGTSYGRWDLAFLAFEAYLRRVSVIGPGVREPLQEVDPVSHANVLLGLLNSAWRCGVEVLRNVQFDWHQAFPVISASVTSTRPGADLRLLRRLLETVSQDGTDLVEVVRERDFELAALDVPAAYERIMNCTAEGIPDRDAQNILIKPIVARAFAAAHMAFLQNRGQNDVEVAAAFYRFLQVVEQFMGDSDNTAIDVIRTDAVLCADVRKMLNIYKHIRSDLTARL